MKVGYQDLNVGLGSSLAPDVQRMKAANVDAVITCMDVNDNISLSRAMQQYGMGSAAQVWLNGQDQSVLNRYSGLMQHVYFLLQHVPFSAATIFPGKYPGIEQYIKYMNKYEPAYTYEETSVEGWISGALFVEGLRGAGRNPTQASVIAADNRLKAFTGGNITTPVDWSTAHNISTPPYCSAYVKVVGKKLIPVFVKAPHVFFCFHRVQSQPLPIKTPAGVPGG
jgi:hypothetical protein